MSCSIAQPDSCSDPTTILFLQSMFRSTDIFKILETDALMHTVAKCICQIDNSVHIEATQEDMFTAVNFNPVFSRNCINLFLDTDTQLSSGVTHQFDN